MAVNEPTAPRPRRPERLDSADLGGFPRRPLWWV